MRFMMIMFPKSYQNAKPGTVPDLKDIEVTRRYNEQLQKAGVLLALDGLTPPSTMSARVTFKNGKSKVTDGPFTETKEVVGGYWVIQVKSREEALEWASRIPGKDDQMVEVRRLFDISDFPADVQEKLAKLEKEIAEGS
ncbi:MAG: YciI family protein [Candidatus Acidiferrum sp.]